MDIKVVYDRVQKVTPNTVVLLAEETDDFSKAAVDTPYMQKSDFAKLVGTDVAKQIMAANPTKHAPASLSKPITAMFSV